MPHLTRPHSQGDPVLDLWVTVSAPYAEALRKDAKPVPNPIRVRLLLDTGAKSTCLDCLVIYDGPGQSFILSF